MVARSSLAMLAFETVLGIMIIWIRPYTEIDWKAYMQEVEGFLSGDLNYENLRGDTGPLVYPAGFLYLFSALYYICSRGTNIAVLATQLAQCLFLGLYIVNHLVLLKIYDALISAGKVKPFSAFLLSCSYRVHSIFLLRMFNDPGAMTLFHCSVLAMIHNRWNLAVIVYSLALSVKMNILLYLPGLLLLLILAKGPLGVIGGVFLIVAVQVVVGLPFLLTFPAQYFGRAFEFNRQFDMKWSVNLQFLDAETFASPRFHLALLMLHVFLLLVFLVLKGSAGKSLSARLLSLNCPLNPSKWLAPTREISPPGAFYIDIVQALFTVNIIGIACCRSLHYQFYSWYYFTIPYFIGVQKGAFQVVALGAWAALELVYATYPPNSRNSLILQGAHWTLVVTCMQVLALWKTEKLKSVSLIDDKSKGD